MEKSLCGAYGEGLREVFELMGRGQIISGGESGQYQVKLIYAYRSRVEDKITKAQQNITAIQGQITKLDAEIAAETDEKKKADLVIKRSVLRLQIASLEKQIEYYQTKMPADPTVTAWCMDFTEDLTGNVGTAEIPGEPVTILIRPGYNNGAVYNSTRDGQLMPAVAGEPNQVLFNWMLLPGWQRHMPIYRIGTIVSDSIDYGAHTCAVCLDPAFSSQQYLPAVDGLAIGDCESGIPYSSQIADFCSKYPDHPFATNTDEGSEINITDGQFEQLKTVNEFVNQNYGRENDQSGFTIGDSWDVMSVGGKGDCEDFALTKMQKLVTDYGWNPANLKLVTAYMPDGTGHAFLAVRTSNRGLVALDVNFDNVIESGKLPYRVGKIAMTKDVWKNYTRKLSSVAVEYMGCNSLAFSDGDRVVVQFIDQDWSKPKVIGFAENPQSCINGTFVFSGVLYTSGDYASHSVIRISQSLEIAINLASMPNQDSANHSATFSGLKFQVCGGRYRDGYSDFYSSNYQYDYFADSFETKTSMPSERFYADGFSLNDKSFIVAGVNSGTKPPFLPVVWDFDQTLIEYSVAGDNWTNRSGFGSDRLGIQSFVVDGESYFFSGFNDVNIPNPPDRIQKKYSALTDTWSESVTHLFFNPWFSAVFSALDTGVVVGGVDGDDTGGSPVSSYDVNGYNSNKTWKFDPVAGTWSGGSDFSISGSIRSMGSDGKANLGFVIGGDEFINSPTDWGTPYRTYNPVSDSWATREIQKMMAGNGASITA